MALLELQGIVAGYVDGIDILDDVNLGVARGSVTGGPCPVHSSARSSPRRRSSAAR